MADSTKVAAVMLQIPDEAAVVGYDTAAVGVLLDSGLTQTHTILAVLRGMVAKSAAFENITESGSTRDTQFFTNLNALLTYWQAQADKEDITSGTNVKEGARLWTGVRV